MQTQDSLTVSRRPLDVDDYIDIARRHKGWIIGPTFAGIVIAVVVAYLIPDKYVSSATIKVVPQQVPETLIQPNVNQLMSDRITSIASQVESRTVLGAIITTNNLYPRERDRMPLEDVIEGMRKDIRITAVSNMNTGMQQNARVPAFQIQFKYTDRAKAQKVVQELATRFIDQNLRELNSTSIGTTTLLRDEWEAAKRELDAAEAKLAEFRARNRGRLPDEMQSTLSQLNALQVRLANVNSSLSRISQEKLVMETQLRIYRDQISQIDEQAAKAPTEALARSDKYVEAERAVKYWENQLTALRQQYTDTYPDVQRAMSMLDAAKKKRDEAAKDEPSSKNADGEGELRLAPMLARQRSELEANYRRLQSQIQAKDLEAEQNQKELERVKEAIASYESRLQGAPFSDKEYAELLRDRELAKTKFMDLDAKRTRSQLAQEMVNRSQGERLEILDQASLPSEPSEPKRTVMVGIGAAAGLMLGMMFAGAREMKDTSLKNLKDVRAYTQLPILGSVPLLENDAVVKRRRRMAWLAWSVACLAGVAIMTGSIVYYYMRTA
jgi:succinoglycan biosynthesis transport protein ExoP